MKALKKAWGLKGLHDERERREKEEHKLGRGFRFKIMSAYKWRSSLLK